MSKKINKRDEKSQKMIHKEFHDIKDNDMPRKQKIAIALNRAKDQGARIKGNQK